MLSIEQRRRVSTESTNYTCILFLRRIMHRQSCNDRSSPDSLPFGKYTKVLEGYCNDGCNIILPNFHHSGFREHVGKMWLKSKTMRTRGAGKNYPAS